MLHFKQFNKLCHFFEQEIIPDGLGGHGINWRECYVAWAKIVPIIPDRKSQGVKPASPWTHRLYTRYHAIICERMKVIYQEYEYEIDKVINWEEKSNYLALMLIRREK
jgi:SPP1 family predicted phage head-tail adaptor